MTIGSSTQVQMELTSRVPYARLWLLDFRLLQRIRMWGILEGSNGCHYRGLPQDKLWDTLISNVATQPKHHSYIVNRTLTDSGYCNPGQSHQIKQSITLSIVAWARTSYNINMESNWIKLG
jgi:hypothetical protein